MAFPLVLFSDDRGETEVALTPNYLTSCCVCGGVNAAAAATFVFWGSCATKAPAGQPPSLPTRSALRAEGGALLVLL